MPAFTATSRVPSLPDHLFKQTVDAQRGRFCSGRASAFQVSGPHSAGSRAARFERGPALEDEAIPKRTARQPDQEPREGVITLHDSLRNAPASALGEALGKKREVPLGDHGSGPHDGPEFVGVDVQLKAPPAQALSLRRQDRVQPDVGRRQPVAKPVQNRRRRHPVQDVVDKNLALALKDGGQGPSSVAGAVVGGGGRGLAGDEWMPADGGSRVDKELAGPGPEERELSPGSRPPAPPAPPTAPPPAQQEFRNGGPVPRLRCGTLKRG
jgi:hypothetical protein